VTEEGGVLFFQNVLTGPRPNKRVGKSADFLPNFHPPATVSADECRR
jgi:hypothetical protein